MGEGLDPKKSISLEESEIQLAVSLYRQIQGLSYLSLVYPGRLTFFVTHTKHFFLRNPHPGPILLIVIFVTQLTAAVIAGLGI